MSPLKAAIKSEARGEPIRWQATPRKDWLKPLKGLLPIFYPASPLRHPAFVLTERRLFSIEEQSGEYVVRSAPILHVKELLANPGRITGGNPENREVRLLQDLHVYCPTTAINAFKRALDRIR